MKAFMKICTILLMVLSAQKLVAQTATTGDYRSVQSGNWSSVSTWQVRDGSGNWTTPSVAPTSSNNVYIQLLHKVTVDVATASCNDLHLQTTDTLGIGSNTLEVSGKIRSYNSYQITNGALTSNVVTITTSAAHGLSVGQSVIIGGISAGTLAPVNGTYTLASVPPTTTFTYALTNADIASTTSGATTGSVTKNSAAITSGVDGTFYSAQVSSTAINGTMCTSTSGAGGIKFIGNSRNITTSGEWTANSISFLVDINFALNSGQTGAINTVFGGRNLTFTSGTVSISTRMTPGAGSPGTGTATIKNGATLLSTVAGSTQILSRTSTSTFGTFTIEAGGTLEITGSSSLIDAKTIVNNGNVVYNRGGTQTLISKGGSTDVAPNNSADFTSYNNLTIKTSGNKTIPSGITINVSGTLTLGSTASSCILASTGGSSLTYSPGATLTLNGTQSIALTTTSLEWPATNGPTNITVNSNILSFTASAGISRTVTGTMTLNGGSFTVGAGNTLTFANGSTIARGGATSALNQSSGTINYGTASTDVINISILPSSAISLGNELTSGTASNLNLIGTYGTLTVGSGSTYTMTGGRTIANLVNNGIVALTPTTTYTFTINGNVSGSGTLTGHDSASLVFGGNGSGSAGTLAFTTGGEKMNNLTINRIGTNGSIAINQPITVNRNISLTAGTLVGGTNTITVRGGVSGAGICTATGSGKVVLNGTTNTGSLTLGSVTLTNLEMGASTYSLAGSPIITGTLDLKSYVLRTSTSTISLSSTGTLSRTTGWVFGTLKKYVSTGSNVAVNFEVGDSLNYTPVSLTFASVTTAGDVSIKSASGASNYANYPTAPLSTSNYINRYWNTSNVNTLAFTSYNATFNYVSGDLVGTATANTVVAAKYTTSWTLYTTTAGSSANTLSSLTSFGDVILGDCGSYLTPSISISTATTSVCSGSNTAFTASATNGGSSPNYQWKRNDVDAGSGGSSITFPSGSLSNHDVISCVLTANNVCQTSATATSNAIQLTVKPSPSVAPINNGSTTVTTASLCTLGAVTKYFNATPYGTWSSTNSTVASVTGGSQAGNVTANLAGTATISYNVAASNGCVSSSTVAVTVAPITPNAVTGNNSICIGATTALSCTAPVGTTGVWSSSNNLGTINVSGVYTGVNAGTYGEARYTVTDNATGCKAFSSRAITVNPTPAVPTITYAPGTVGNPQAGAPTGSFCVGKTFSVVATPNIPAGVWSATGAVSVTSGGVVTINAVGAGSMKYTYTSAAGCVSSRTMSGNGYTCASRGVSLNNEPIVISNDFTMYPNPAKGFINLNVETLVGTGSIVVTDLYGKSVKTQNLSMGTNTVNTSNLSKGFYLVSIITSEGKTTKKLVVE